MEEFSNVKFRIQSMGQCWKIIGIIFMIIPRLCIWTLTLRLGSHLNFKTADIPDMILNTMSVNFILEFGNLVYDRLADWRMKVMMIKLDALECDLDEVCNRGPRNSWQ